MTTPREQLVAEEMANLPKDWNYGANKMSETSQSSLEDAEDRARFAAEQAAERKAKEDAEDAEDRKRAAAEWAHLQASRVNPWVGAGAGAGLGLVGGEARDFVDRGLANVNQLHGVKKYMRTQVDEGLMTPRHLDTIGTAAHGQHVLDTQITPALNAGADLAPNAKFRRSKSGLFVPVEESAMARRASATRDFIRGGMSMPAASPVSRTLGGAGAGYELVDAYNRAREGDFAGAAKSGLGALGAALSTKQGLLPKVIGGGMLAGAEAMKHPEAISPLLKYFNDAAAERKAAGGSVQHFDRGGVVKKAGQELIGRGVDTLMPMLQKLTASDRAAAGRSAAELIKSQPQVNASEAYGQLMERGFKKASTTQTDRTRVGGGNIGGANFSAISEADPAYAGKVWGVKDLGTASRLINLTNPETSWTTMLGSAAQLKSNPIVFDKLRRGFVSSMKEGNLSPELEAKINQNLAVTFGPGAEIRDPSIWKQADTFEKRSALADLMMGTGLSPKKGGIALGGEKSGKGVIFSPTDILKRETESSLLHPAHGGETPTFAVGPRAFSLNKEVSYRPDLHPGFPTLLGGEDLGHNIRPVPTEVFLPDWHAKFKADNPKRKGPGYYDLALGVKGEGLPSQDLNDEYIRHLIREGYNAGGMVGGLDALDRAYA